MVADRQHHVVRPSLEPLEVVVAEPALLELLKTPLFEGLHTLRLQSNGLDASCIEALVNRPEAASLRVLDVRYNPLNSQGAMALAQAPYLANLTWLNVHAADIWPKEGMEALGASTTLPLHIRKYWRR